jgi:hypothetical protein
MPTGQIRVIPHFTICEQKLQQPNEALMKYRRIQVPKCLKKMESLIKNQI